MPYALALHAARPRFFLTYCCNPGLEKRSRGYQVVTLDVGTDAGRVGFNCSREVYTLQQGYVAVAEVDF